MERAKSEKRLFLYLLGDFMEHISAAQKVSLSLSAILSLSLDEEKQEWARSKAGASTVHAKEQEFLCFCCRSSEAIFFCTFNIVVFKVFRDGAKSSSFSRIRFDDDDTRNNSNAEQQQEEQEQNHQRFPKKNELRNSFNAIATTMRLRRSRRRRQRESLATRKRGVL